LKACFRITLTEADKIYISPEHTFHRSDLGYSVKITFLCCKEHSTEQEHSTETDYATLQVGEYFYKEIMKITVDFI
jgi:hypothetical protein